MAREAKGEGSERVVRGAAVTRIEEIRQRLDQLHDPLWPGLTESDWAEDVRFLLEQYDAAVKILAEAEKIVPGLIVTSGSMAL